MLSQKHLNEIKEHLVNSQNPLFFFDNDVDGLCSFLLLQRAIDRGKGVAVKSFPDLDKSYIRKINEFNPDAIFILDKPKVNEEFIIEVEKLNIPLIWIDHHEVQIDKNILKKTHYYNSFPSSEPVTYLSQKIFNRKEDLWLAMIGCVGDVFLPDFAIQFSEEYPDLFNPNQPAFDSLYTTQIGKAVKMLNFGLKDTTTNVVRLMKFLLKAKNIYDLFEENPKTRDFHKRYNQLNKAYQKILDKAEAQAEITNKLFFFEYSGETSMSSEISNELRFKNGDKLVVVAYKKSEKTNLSIRGENAKKITLEAIKDIPNSSGGGHEKATGAQVPTEKLEEFKTNLLKALEKSN
jgi:single-stranded DNA-specific DHH superfamily exonuclease